MSKRVDKKAGISKSPDKGQALPGAVVVFFLLVLSLLPYFQIMDFGFVNYDDPLHVAAQPSVLEGISSESVAWAMTATPGNLWHPLTWVSYMAEVQLFGGGAESPGVHHGGNLFLYAITILLLYHLVRKLGVSTFWACVGVLIFALHPLHSEPVAWISARKDLLSGVFLLASLLGYVMGGAAEGRAKWCWKSLSLIAFAAALLSKPSAVVLPALLILLDWFPLRRCGFEKAGSEAVSWAAVVKSQLRSKGVYFAMALVAAVVAISVQSGGSHQDFASQSSLISRLSDAPGQLAFYFQRLLYPADLIFEYSRPAGAALALYSAAGLILFLAVSCLAWRKRQRFPEIMVGWLWVLVCLSPVVGLVYIGSGYTADRYWYIALVGPALALAFFLQRKTRWQDAKIPVALVVLLVLGMLSFKQTKVWKNDLALFRHAVAVDPHHLTALGNLGSYYRVQKDDVQALKYYEAALKVNPRDHIVHYNIAHIRNNQGDRAGSIAACRACLKGYPNYARAHHLLGVLLADQAHRDTYAADESLVHLRKAFELDQSKPGYAINLVLNLYQQRHREEAIETIHHALRVFPPDSEVSQQLKKWLREIQTSANTNQAPVKAVESGGRTLATRTRPKPSAVPD